MPNKEPEPSYFTVHYSDGSRKIYKEGVLAHQAAAGGVEVFSVNVSTQDFLTLLAALAGAAERIVQEAE